jgi:hypothetical protein
MIRASALLIAGALSVYGGPTQGASDQGTFRVFVGGREVGTEQFSIRQSGTGAAAEFIASGQVSLRLASGSLELTPRLRARGMQADPASYQVDVGGDSPRRIVGNVADGRFSARIVTAAGEQLREYVASAGALVLDEGIAHHYFFLAQRLHSGRVPVIIPRENRQVVATVQDRGEERVEIGGVQVSAYHLVVQPAGTGPANVWVDALNRVLKVEIPDRQYVAVRTEVPR